MKLRDNLRREGFKPWEIRLELKRRKQRLERERWNEFAAKGRARTDFQPKLVAASSSEKRRATIKTLASTKCSSTQQTPQTHVGAAR